MDGSTLVQQGGNTDSSHSAMVHEGVPEMRWCEIYRDFGKVVVGEIACKGRKHHGVIESMAWYSWYKRSSVRRRAGLITRASAGHLPRGDRVCMGRAGSASR